MAVVFPYRRESSSKGNPIYRPVAKVVLVGMNGREVVDYFYVDSGADYTLIPYKLGLFLGLKSQDGDVCEVQGINGVVGVVFLKIKMKIEEHQFEAKIGWAQVEHVPLLLGRADVFDAFEVIFRQPQKEVVFKRFPLS